MTGEEIMKISNNTEVILDSIRKGLIANIENIDMTKIVSFDFEGEYLKISLPNVDKNVSLYDILKTLK